MFDQIFNAFNSNSLKSSQKFRHAFQNDSGHVHFFEDALKFLDMIQLKNDKKIAMFEWMENFLEVISSGRVCRTFLSARQAVCLELATTARTTIIRLR